MRFAVLGPLAATDGGSVVELGSRRLRVLLALLLCEGGGTVSVSRLFEALWEEPLPDSVAKGLQVQVHRLRRALKDDGRVVYRAPGYAIRLAPGELDAHDFERLADEGRRARATGDLEVAQAALSQALGLWQGPAYDGLCDVPALRDDAARLEEERLAALEERFDVDLGLGGHARTVPELTALVAAHPLRERLHGQLMLALYRSGRQADALQVYRDCRRMLIDELGLEPGPELRRLERGILAHDPELAPPRERRRADAGAARPCQLPPDLADFTGRGPQVARITGLLAGAEAERRAVALCAIVGMGGVGKTAIAVHVAHRLRDAFPDGQLYVNLRGAEREPVAPEEALVRLLRALGVDAALIPDGRDARAELYRARLADRRMLVVLDNAASEAQVHDLLPGTPSCGALITSRARLAGLAGVRHVEIDVLSEEHAVELLRRIAGARRVRAEPEAAAEIARLCGCLPLPLRIAGARLARSSHRTLRALAARLADERHRLDELAHGELAVRTSIGPSYRSLGPRERRTFRLLGLLDAPDIRAWMAAAAVETTVAEADDSVDALVDARLLEVAGSDPIGQVRYRFHDLVRVYARERANAEDAQDERAAALDRVGGGLLFLAEEAHRREHGGDHHVLHGGAPRWRPGPRLTGRLLADPLAWYDSERAVLVATIRQAAHLGRDELAWDLANSCLTLFAGRGHYDDWRNTHLPALAAARAAGNRRGEAVLLFDLARLAMDRGRYARARALSDQASRLFEEVEDADGGALVRTVITYLECQRGSFDAALCVGQEAVAAHRARGDRCAEGFTLCAIGVVHLMLGRLEPALAHLRASLVPYEACACRQGRVRTLYWLGEAHLQSGAFDDARGVFQQMLDVARAVGTPRAVANARYGLGMALLGAGRPGDAAGQLEAAEQLAREAGDQLVERQARAARDGLGRPAARAPGEPLPLW